MQKNQKRIVLAEIKLAGFKFPAKTRVNIVRNITLLDPSNNWHQDLEFGRRMDIFGPLEPEIWLFEISLLLLV